MATYSLILVLLLLGVTSAYRISESAEPLIESRSDESLTDPVAIDDEEDIDILQEGDIRYDPEMEEEVKNDGSVPSKRNAQRNHHRLWSGRTVPFTIDSTLTDKTSYINDAINEYHKYTCLRFIPKTNEKHWINFVKKSGCWSYVGLTYGSAGAQDVSLGEGCHHKKTIVHELMHAIGFWHEQSRYDRSKYVSIMWENIPEDKEFNFVRHGDSLMDTLGVVYDYKSVLHYNVNAFSKNGLKTITAVGDPDNVKQIGPGETLSALDIVKINRLYCKDPSSLGLEIEGSLPNSNFSASSYKDFFGLYNPHNGRLKGESAWCAKDNDVSTSYIQVDLGSDTAVRSLATQGNAIYAEWVTQYSIKYSSDKVTWQTYSENGVDKVFTGNSDQSTIVKHKLPSAINARYIRFYPKAVHVWLCMRIGLYGEEPTNKIGLWSSWAPCDRTTCIKKRQRLCISSNLNECPTSDSYGVETQSVACTKAECEAPIHGHWARWGKWGPCSKTCDVGTHTRSRNCSDPPPSFGGNNCVGSNTMTGSCEDVPCSIGPEGCTFTKDLCKWTLDSSANILWNRHASSTRSSETGPSGDHTSPDGTGFYIYLEASGVPAGSKAILRSAEQSGSSGQNCLTFYYHMHGKTMGTLNVKIKTASTETTIFTRSGSSGDKWLQAKKTFSSTLNYFVLFEGIRGSQWSSDMALDDISLHPRACQ